MYVCLCSVSPVTSCSHGRVTVCESDDPSSNPAQCFLVLFFLSLLGWADICAAELATWGVGPDVRTLRWYANSVDLDITTALF